MIRVVVIGIEVEDVLEPLCPNASDREDIVNTITAMCCENLGSVFLALPCKNAGE